MAFLSCSALISKKYISPTFSLPYSPIGPKVELYTSLWLIAWFPPSPVVNWSFKCFLMTDTSLGLRQAKLKYGRQSASILPFHLPPSPTMVGFEVEICAHLRVGI